MKAQSIRDLTRDEVVQRRTEIEEELFNLVLKKRTKELDNPLRIRNLRRDLARINTILHEEELGLGKLAESGKLLADEKE